MINSVRNNAKPTNTMLGGVCPVPKAWRSNDITMMTRTKEVIMSSNDGNSVSAVIKANSCRVRLYWLPPGALVTLINGTPCACATEKPSPSTIRMAAITPCLIVKENRWFMACLSIAKWFARSCFSVASWHGGHPTTPSALACDWGQPQSTRHDHAPAPT